MYVLKRVVVMDRGGCPPNWTKTYVIIDEAEHGKMIAGRIISRWCDEYASVCLELIANTV